MPTVHQHPIRNPLSEVDKMAGIMSQILPALTSKVAEVKDKILEHDNRIAAVEDQQRRLDPRAIEERMFVLHQLKKLLVDGTKGQPRAVTHPGYWQSLKKHLKIASFQNRAALTVDQMEKAIEFARNWCFERGVQPPTLFDQSSQEATG